MCCLSLSICNLFGGKTYGNVIMLAPRRVVVAVVVVLYLMLTDPLRIRRGLKIDGTKPNQTGNAFGDKQRKQTEENGQESNQQRTSSR